MQLEELHLVPMLIILEVSFVLDVLAQVLDEGQACSFP